MEIKRTNYVTALFFNTLHFPYNLTLSPKVSRDQLLYLVSRQTHLLLSVLRKERKDFSTLMFAALASEQCVRELDVCFFLYRIFFLPLSKYGVDFHIVFYSYCLILLFSKKQWKKFKWKIFAMLTPFLHYAFFFFLKAFTLLYKAFHIKIFQLEDNLKEDALKHKQIKVFQDLMAFG